VQPAHFSTGSQLHVVLPKLPPPPPPLPTPALPISAISFRSLVVVPVCAAGSFMSLAVLSATLVERIIWVACECFTYTLLAATLYVLCGRVCFTKMLATSMWLHLPGLALGMPPPIVQLEEEPS